MAYNPKDYYFKKAKEENYAARSVFKLQEIDQRFRVLKTGFKVLDLGAAPGSWSQFAAQKIGLQGRVLGVDLQKIQITLPNAVFIQADMRELDLDHVMRSHQIAPPFDLVMSDMAPKTSGIRLTDQMRSLELCELALGIAKRLLRPGGTFICKLFHSNEFEGFRDQLRANFEKVEILRPQSTRKESKEIFLIGLRMKGKTSLKSETPPAP
jgi:23S rRNA (uridine2552-2'-O)-methyltransferase